MGIKNIESRKKIHYMKYLAVFAITCLIFMIGLVIGYKISDKKISTLNNMQEDFKNKIIEMEIEYMLVSENACLGLNSQLLENELYDLSNRLEFMENSFGQDNEEVKRLKEYYYSLEIKQWMFEKKLKKECNLSFAHVLFFYDSDKNCPRCKEQGSILTNIRMNNELVKIYSFDIDSKNRAVQTLMKVYNVSNTAPVIVINDKPYYEFSTKSDLTKRLADSS